jgi:hypothetical protein
MQALPRAQLSDHLQAACGLPLVQVWTILSKTHIALILLAIWMRTRPWTAPGDRSASMFLVALYGLLRGLLAVAVLLRALVVATL